MSSMGSNVPGLLNSSVVPSASPAASPSRQPSEAFSGGYLTHVPVSSPSRLSPAAHVIPLFRRLRRFAGFQLAFSIPSTTRRL